MSNGVTLPKFLRPFCNVDDSVHVFILKKVLLDKVSQITNVLYTMGSELQSVAMVMSYKKVRWLKQWYIMFWAKCGVCALWLVYGEITQEVIVSSPRKGER